MIVWLAAKDGQRLSNADERQIGGLLDYIEQVAERHEAIRDRRAHER
jgi:hypothetical protein